MPDSPKTQATAHSIPLMQEAVEIGKEQVETGIVRVRKISQEFEQPISMGLQSQSVNITRVPVNKTVERVFEARQEGSTLVVPIFEEVITKQIILKEEVRITVQNEQHDLNDSIILKSEKAVIERYDTESGEWKAETS